MNDIGLEGARGVVDKVIAAAVDRGIKPVAVAFLDARGCLKAFAAQDGTALKRGDFAIAKALSAISMGMGSRSLEKRAREKPDFVSVTGQVLGAPFMVMRGGVLVRTVNGAVVGAVGVSGDSSDNDELVAMDGVWNAGFIADAGQN